MYFYENSVHFVQKNIILRHNLYTRDFFAEVHIEWKSIISDRDF